MRYGPMMLVLAALIPAVPAGAQGLLHKRPRQQAPAELRRTPEKTFPFDAIWVLQAVGDKPVTVSDPPSFSIDQTLRGRGFGGCNSFSMSLYPIKDQRLASGGIAVTNRRCAPEITGLEHTVMLALHSLPHWDVQADGDLIVKAPNATLRFRRGV